MEEEWQWADCLDSERKAIIEKTRAVESQHAQAGVSAGSRIICHKQTDHKAHKKTAFYLRKGPRKETGTKP